MKSQKSINPWFWVPTLYFLEGIPYVLVNQVSTMMFTKMGVPNGQMALFTSLLYLPWVIKPFWSPFVDLIKTKRWWTIAMQVLLTAAFIGLTVSIPHPDAAMIAAQQTPMSMFTAMLVIFWITAFASATHDIAADGFYMLGLSQNDQALFVGIRSTFYRIATIFGQGAVLYIAGRLEASTSCLSQQQTHNVKRKQDKRILPKKQNPSCMNLDAPSLLSSKNQVYGWLSSLCFCIVCQRHS